MTDKQPEALRIAELFSGYEADHAPNGWPAIQQRELTYAAITLRAQHAAIERKDALLRQALEVLEFDMGKFAFGDYYAAREEAVGAITKELAK